MSPIYRRMFLAVLVLENPVNGDEERELLQPFQPASIRVPAAYENTGGLPPDVPHLWPIREFLGERESGSCRVHVRDCTLQLT